MPPHRSTGAQGRGSTGMRRSPTTAGDEEEMSRG